jgi:hypothetical protein
LDCLKTQPPQLSLIGNPAGVSTLPGVVFSLMLSSYILCLAIFQFLNLGQGAKIMVSEEPNQRLNEQTAA